MIPRRLLSSIQARLAQFPAVALLGPRQVGKTTLALEAARTVNPQTGPGLLGGSLLGTPPHELYLDLESANDRRKLSDAEGFLRAYESRLVILDEIHRAPEIFATLRGLIDEGIRRGRKAGRFLILGSASIDLLRQSSETLAGRIAFLELQPLDATEVDAREQERLWVRGGFPKSFLAASDEESAIWREDFIKTYLERDIPQLGPRIPAETLGRFWTMLAHRQGGLWNAADLARSLGVDGKTVAKYLDIFVDLLLVRRLTPLHVNVSKRLTKSPKTFIRDSGVVHSLLNLDDREAVLGSPVSGGSWEGFVIENILAIAPRRTAANFYRSAAGAEIDLVLTLPGDETWAIEIKRGAAPAIERGFYNALEDVAPARAFVVHSGDDRYPLKQGVEAISLREICSMLAARVA
ncbi:MAG: ATP-binding protein [Pseudomonadota bacterium]